MILFSFPEICRCRLSISPHRRRRQAGGEEAAIASRPGEEQNARRVARVVGGRKYPSALFVTGDGDTRVAPLHARKMTAQLQSATASSRPILLLYDTKSGHSGGRPINKQIEENTDILSFLFWQLGVPTN